MCSSQETAAAEKQQEQQEGQLRLFCLELLTVSSDAHYYCETSSCENVAAMAASGDAQPRPALSMHTEPGRHN